MFQHQEQMISQKQQGASTRDHPSGSPPFIGETSYVVDRIAVLCQRMKEAVYPRRIATEEIQLAGPVDRIAFEEAKSLPYRSGGMGDALGPTFATFWYRIRIRVPHEWVGSRVDLAWSSNSEALLWVDGRSVQGLNPGRETARLIDQTEGGEELTVYVEVACNHLLGPDGTPGLPWPVPTNRPSHWLQTCELREFDPEAWDLYHDLRVLAELLFDRVPPQETVAIGLGELPLVRPALDSAWAGRLLYDLNAVCNVLDPSDSSTWDRTRVLISKLLKVRNGGMCHELSAVGHAHIDTAWLWPVAEAYRKTVRTFSSVVRQMDEYPEFLFACSQAYQYACIERQNPDLFKLIREKVDAGQWIPVGGSFVEPDCNLPSGESFCRQFLFGQKYFESRFGKRCTEFWNPDVFGYAGQLPQIMRLAGIDNFITQKLSWNRFTSPPHHTFYWESPDGSRVLTHFPPADTYSGTCEISQLRYHAANYKDSDRGSDAYYLFGHGDGGGGPTPEMLETLRRAKDLLGVPRCKQRTPEDFFQRLRRNTRSIPTITGELYLQGHRATFTSQAMMKRGLRKSERLLHDVELVGVLGHYEANASFPRDKVNQLWEKLLLNQFHDILPGSSIAEVHEQARTDFASILEYGQAIREELLEHLAHSRNLSVEPLPLNTTSVPRKDVVESPNRGLTLVESPPMGFGRYVDEELIEEPVTVELQDGKLHLQNGLISAVLSETGQVIELTDLSSDCQLLSSAGNTLVMHDDRPSLWDAWDVEPSILETGSDCASADSCHIESQGPYRAEIVFQRQLGDNSVMTQTIRLDAASRRLEFHCDVQWQEEHKLLKVVFPTTVRADRATFEMPFGYAERPTHTNTSDDAAQFEVPGHRWADLSEPGRGLALLTDCKYGFSVHRGILNLSLLRAPTYPDENCDKGSHQFSYAVVPHQGDWRTGGVLPEAITFNQPLLWVNRQETDSGRSFFDVEGELVLDTVKLAEAGSGVVLRLYEPYGKQGSATLKTRLPFASASRSNVMEDELSPMELVVNNGEEEGEWTSLSFDYRASEVICFLFR